MFAIRIGVAAIISLGALAEGLGTGYNSMITECAFFYHD